MAGFDFMSAVTAGSQALSKNENLKNMVQNTVQNTVQNAVQNSAKGGTIPTDAIWQMCKLLQTSNPAMEAVVTELPKLNGTELATKIALESILTGMSKENSLTDKINVLAKVASSVGMDASTVAELAGKFVPVLTKVAPQLLPKLLPLISSLGK